MKKWPIYVAAAGLAGVIGAGILYNNKTLPHTSITIPPSPAESRTLEVTVGQLDKARDNTETVRKRQAFLENVVQDLTLPYVEKVEYDHDGTKKLQYVDIIAQRHSSPGQVNLAGPRPLLGSSGNYEVAILNAIPDIGKGYKSPIFFGTALFDNSQYKSYGALEFKDILLKLNKHAQIYHSGFPNIDSNLLGEKVKSGELNPMIVYALSEIDADLYCLHKSPLSAQLPESIRRVHATNTAVQLETLKREYFKASPFGQHLIRTALANNGIIISTLQVPLPKTPKNKSF